MKSPKDDSLNEILAAIEREFPDIRTELVYETPFQFLMAVMLSAQTTDKQVNRVTPPIFAQVRSSADLAILPLSEFEPMIRSVNFFRNKARHIHATAKILHERYGDVVPDDLDSLVAMPGIGMKTAKVVLGVLYDRPYVGVDTHVHRVLNRIGIVRTKTPLETDREVERRFTEDQKHTIHHPLVLFGRYRCLARKPRCGDCPLRPKCLYYQHHIDPA
ncbi:MAG TPA: endonuclease III [bacterium]|nr:endonuclease III [bacterium]